VVCARGFDAQRQPACGIARRGAGARVWRRSNRL